MTAGFKILTRKNPKFPAKFTKEMKVNLYNNVMDYYSKQENFEYCTQLSQSLNKINNETNSK
tara:strand:+ start:160 stop:345 length:186 start_codon:yes stop_codon:yes gene_type:complete